MRITGWIVLNVVCRTLRSIGAWYRTILLGYKLRRWTRLWGCKTSVKKGRGSLSKRTKASASSWSHCKAACFTQRGFEGQWFADSSTLDYREPGSEKSYTAVSVAGAIHLRKKDKK